MVNTQIKKYVYQYLTSKHPNIIEVGAHFGEDTVDMLQVMSPSVIYCFEPDPRNLKIAKAFIDDSRVKIFDLAISNEHNKLVDFYQGYSSTINPKMFEKYHWIDKNLYVEMKLNGSGASSLKSGHPLVVSQRPSRVKTVRLDKWAMEHKVRHIDFLWIDVQGGEKDVIESLGTYSDKVICIWMEYGEMQYEEASNRRTTVKLVSSLDFYVDKKMSERGKTGNLLFWKNGNGPNS